MTAIEILRAASRSVPNEDYVQFMAAVDAVEGLIESADVARVMLSSQGMNLPSLDAALANVGGVE
jgi:hypothetical protein